ncbi:lytic murein transglycosylase [Nocardioides sp. CPCC 205120]|uniref:lytic murein transglycosylase n=1 Tax=Nocardioides sp. CPCC 205120 TaxID=3406462 RepID=UPI003B513D1C
MKRTPTKKAAARRPAAAPRRGRHAVPGLLVVVAVALLGAAWWAAREPTPEPAVEPGTSALGEVAPPPAAEQPLLPPGRPVVPVVDPAWTADVAARTGLPPVAANAYAVAELRVRAEDPECAIGWATLAGIGYVESRHGTISGSILGLDGRSSPPVLGPALDGTGSFAAIPSHPALVRWHGDTVWDHAVGPMQFIGSTWARWGADGDGDGEADPNDLDDAAYAAARYLCHDDNDLATGQGWSDAVFSYNHDQSYVDAVHAAASGYAARSAEGR